MRIQKSLAGLTVILLGAGIAAGVAMAETPAGYGPSFMMGGGHGGMMGMTGPSTFVNPVNISALKTELAITQAQESAWDAYAKVLQDNASSAEAQHRTVDPNAIQAMSVEDRRQFMTTMMEQGQSRHNSVKAAAEALLPSLTDFQKGKATTILPGLASQGMGGMGMGGPMMR